MSPVGGVSRASCAWRVQLCLCPARLHCWRCLMSCKAVHTSTRHHQLRLCCLAVLLGAHKHVAARQAAPDIVHCVSSAAAAAATPAAPAAAVVAVSQRALTGARVSQASTTNERSSSAAAAHSAACPAALGIWSHSRPATSRDAPRHRACSSGGAPEPSCKMYFSTPPSGVMRWLPSGGESGTLQGSCPSSCSCSCCCTASPAAAGAFARSCITLAKAVQTGRSM